MLHHGATPEVWDHFASTLGLAEHLLPVVSNPHATISANSNMQAIGKTPSVYNRNGEVAGFPKWTQHQSTPADIATWSAEPDYGICVQARAVRAIDIDVPDRAVANMLREEVEKIVGALPLRWRSDSGKQLLAFRYAGEMPKRVLPVSGGIIEFLGDGQQFIAIGRHPQGELYKWGGDKSRRGKPIDIPELSEEQLETLWSSLVSRFANGTPQIARQRRAPGEILELPVHDDVADWINENWETYDVGSDAQIFMRCPFDGEHTSDSGPSATAYFPAGTGGYQQGHFVCLHAHCAGRDDHDYKEAIGYNLAQFDDLTGGCGLPDRRAGLPALAGAEPADRNARHGDRATAGAVRAGGGPGFQSLIPVASETTDDYVWPGLPRNKAGKIDSAARYLVPAIACPGMIHQHLAYDTFRDALMTRMVGEMDWRRFGDADMIAIRIELEERGFAPMGKELLRDAVASVAHTNIMDSAQTWLGGLSWDGVPRVDRFATEVWGWDDTPYATAVSRYVWSALAGRIMHPGVRADMVPILVGLQGARKTTLIQMMAPDEEMYTEVRLDEKDDNVSRKLRGKLVGELEELRGLNSRAMEEIKAFITRRKEAWVPKFKEFENYFWRRLLMFGTTNETELLADATGERRWLPGRCGAIDVEQMVRFRDQYWAEGATMFALDGVLWEDAERLAKFEHAKFKVGDAWRARLTTWLGEPDIQDVRPIDKGYIAVDEALGALGIMPAHANRSHEMRVQKVLVGMGFERDVIDGIVIYRREA